MSQRFSLDRQTFERFLAAAHLVQQVQSQALRFTLNSSENVGLLGLVETQQAIQTGTLDLQTACFQVTSLALKLTGAQGAGVWLFTKDTFAFRAGAGTASNSERLRLAVLAGLAGTKSDTDTPDLHDSVRCAKAKSLVVAPIYQGPKVAGALAVFSQLEKAFSDREAASTRLLAGTLSHAVDKAVEAELKHSVALERAAMQQVIERLIPSLMRLTGQDLAAATSKSSNTERGESQGSQDVSLASARTMSVPSGMAAAVPELPAQRPEDVLALAGPLRRPERTFAQEAELAETNPRWVESLNPGFQRWVPFGPAEPSSAPARPPAEAEPTSAAARVAGLQHEVKQPISRSPQTGLPETSNRVPIAIVTTAPPSASASVASGARLSPTVSRWREFLQIVNSVPQRLRSIGHFRINVRFAFNYRPTLWAMGLGLTAALLSLAAFVALQSGESAMLTTLAAGSSANATEADPVRNASVRGPGAVVPATQTNSRVAPKAQAPAAAGETSHLRITDSRASSALVSLSRYEMSSLQRRAEYGDDAAAFVLGMAYELGRGVPRSCTQAAKWVTVAAQQGNAAAEYNLSLRYRTADGVKANPEEAKNWFRKAARHRYSQASPLPAETPETSRAAGQP